MIQQEKEHVHLRAKGKEEDHQEWKEGGDKLARVVVVA